jgi:hypothetical protein
VALPSKVRDLLTGIYIDLLEPDELGTVAMAAHELLENLLKYAANGTSSFHVEICEAGGKALVRLRTSNDASPECAETLERLVADISAARDPMAMYDELVASSPMRPGSGLGLIRIHAEGQMQIAMSRNGRHVTLVAERSISLRRRAWIY